MKKRLHVIYLMGFVCLLLTIFIVGSRIAVAKTTGSETQMELININTASKCKLTGYNR